MLVIRGGVAVVVEKLLDWLGPMSVRRSWRLVWKLPPPTYIKPQIVTTSLKNSGDRLTVCQDSPSQTFSKLAKPSWIYIFPERVQTLIFNDKFPSVQEEVKWEILRKTMKIYCESPNFNEFIATYPILINLNEFIATHRMPPCRLSKGGSPSENFNHCHFLILPLSHHIHIYVYILIWIYPFENITCSYIHENIT